MLIAIYRISAIFLTKLDVCTLHSFSFVPERLKWPVICPELKPTLVQVLWACSFSMNRRKPSDAYVRSISRSLRRCFPPANVLWLMALRVILRPCAFCAVTYTAWLRNPLPTNDSLQGSDVVNR